MIIFLNDNGGSDHSGSNGPLRDIKGSVYEGGVRVPMLIMSGPTVEKDTTYGQHVTYMDILPTLLKLAGG